MRAPWFDRPLSVAGRVLVQNGTAIETKLICIDRDLLMIPSVAIHMNRDANEGASYNVQNDMCPVFGDADAKGGWKKLIAQEAGGRGAGAGHGSFPLQSPARHICRAE